MQVPPSPSYKHALIPSFATAIKVCKMKEIEKDGKEDKDKRERERLRKE